MGGAGVVIEAMRTGDVGAVAAIERASYRAPWARKVFYGELDRQWARVDVLREPTAAGADEIVAFCNYWLVHDEVHLLNLATRPDRRRMGHARRLLVHLVDVATRHGCRYVTLEVRRSNAHALDLYRGHGFREVGLRPNYYVESREDAIVMLLELPS